MKSSGDVPVASAVAAALVGAGPILLGLVSKIGQNRVLGILLAAVATTTGAGGQLWVFVSAGSKLAIPGASTWLPALGVAAEMLLGFYVINSIRAVLTEGVDVQTTQTVAVATTLHASLTATSKAGPGAGEPAYRIPAIKEMVNALAEPAALPADITALEPRARRRTAIL